MKKKFLGLLTTSAIACFLAHGVTYMHVEKNNGTVDSYDVEEVSKVTYSEELSSDTASGESDVPSYARTRRTAPRTSSGNEKDGHEYVDLGLPSGLLWATCNVGATRPTEAGDYFAWGETATKEHYDLDNYKWMDEATEDVLKYCIDKKFGTVDGKDELDSEDDAAVANWGGEWRMPTDDEMKEMVDGCYWEWTDNFEGSGMAGRVGISKKNGNAIFLPAAGQNGDNVGKRGYYLTSSLCPIMNDQATCVYNWDIMFDKNVATLRYYGSSVRAVNGKKILADGVSVSGKIGEYWYVDLGLPSGMKWATYNLGASDPTEIGSLYAWGEIEPKTEGTWKNYKWSTIVEVMDAKGKTKEKHILIKYSSDDQKTLLSAEDDAAVTLCGETWRMPTAEDTKELIDGCVWKWVDNFNGKNVSGYFGKSKKNGNTIFFSSGEGGWMCYWLSTLTCSKIEPSYLESLGRQSDYLDFPDMLSGSHEYGINVYYNERILTCPIRAVSGEINKYGVYFYTEDGTLIEHKVVNHGEAATGVYPPEKDGYVAGWKDSSFMNVTENLRIYAKYEPLEDVQNGVSVTGMFGDYSYVDLGLSVRWATCNVGATKPTEKGSYFAWGETTPKEIYDMSTYRWGDATAKKYTKYCVNAEFGTVVDGVTELEPQDDAASVICGDAWRMPTEKEFKELWLGCSWKWTTDFNGSGEAGLVGTSKINGKIIFLPYAATLVGDKYGTTCSYSTSSLFSLPDNGRDVSAFYFWENYLGRVNGATRECGRPVRGVIEKRQEFGTSISGKENGITYVDLGLPSGLKWATCNVGASKPYEYGGYYAWGEVTTKDAYSYKNYKYGDLNFLTIDRRNYLNSIGCPEKDIYEVSVLKEGEDIASIAYGGEWRMPTEADRRELMEGCEWTWTDNFNSTGIKGVLGKSKTNSNTIFIPAAGYKYDSYTRELNVECDFWTASLSCYSHEAFSCFSFTNKGDGVKFSIPFVGMPVRAVIK